LGKIKILYPHKQSISHGYDFKDYVLDILKSWHIA